MKSLFSLEQYTKIFPRLKRKLSESSQFGKKLIELRKLRNFYEKPSQKYLQTLYKKSNSPSQSSFSLFRFLESRLDVVLYRAHFFESIASAKQQIGIGRILVNNKKVFSPAYNLLPGDIIRVSPNCKERKNFKDDSPAAKTSFKESLLLTKKKRKKSGWRFQTVRAVSTPFFILLFAAHLKKDAIICNTTQFCIDKKTNMVERKTIVNNLLSRLSKLSFKDFLLADTRKIWCSENQFKEGAISSIRNFAKKKGDTQGDAFSKAFGASIEHNLKRENKGYKDSWQQEQIIKKGITSNLPFSLKENNVSFKGADLVNNSKKPFEISNWLFCNFVLFLKKQTISLRKKSFCFFQQKNQPFFKKQSFFVAKKIKPLHLEISYRSRSIVFLFPPQRVCFPYFIDLSQIYK